MSLLLIACSGDDNPSTKKNTAPSAPVLIYPTNNLLCIDNSLEFKWDLSMDIDGDAVKYIIEVSKDNQFSTIIELATVSTTSKVFTLEKGIAYYWRVKATDSKNESSAYSATYSLYTEGNGVSNHLPFAPELVKPLLNSEEQSGIVTLEWIGSDTDNDSLTYDVYFGETNNPTAIISENQSQSSYDVSVIASSTYYWKVVVKDNKGGQSLGQVWYFKTN